MNDPATAPDDPQRLAEAAGQAMYAADRASRALDMQLEAVRPGFARMTMTVREDMLNGHDTCHGGYIFALADSAFAFACNSRNQVTVAAGAAIEYLAPARLGDRLSAAAVERSLAGRTGVYDVEVRNQDNRCIALFRGKSHRVRGAVIPGTEQL